LGKPNGGGLFASNNGFLHLSVEDQHRPTSLSYLSLFLGLESKLWEKFISQGLIVPFRI
jgi:hypothetical protein